MNNIERIALSVQKNKTMKKDNHKKYSKLIQKKKASLFFPFEKRTNCVCECTFCHREVTLLNSQDSHIDFLLHNFLCPSWFCEIRVFCVS